MAAIQPTSEAILAQYVWKYALDLAAKNKNSVVPSGKTAPMNMVWKFVNTVHTHVRANLFVDQGGFVGYWALLAAAAGVDYEQYEREIPRDVHRTLLDNFNFFGPFVLGQSHEWSERLKNNGPELQDRIESGRAGLYKCWESLPQLCSPPEGHGQFSPAHLARLGLTSHIAYLGGSSNITQASISHAQLMVIDTLIAFHCLYDALEYEYFAEIENPLIQQYVSLSRQVEEGASQKKRFSCPVTSIEQAEALTVIGYQAAQRAFAGEQLNPLLQSIADRSIFWVAPGGSRILASESKALASIKAEVKRESAQSGQLDPLLQQLVC